MADSGDSAFVLSQLIVPRSWSDGVIAVLGGYIDGSNLHTAARLVSVGGCAANTDRWVQWEAVWKELLALAGVKRWDHSAFLAKRYPLEPNTPRFSEGRWLRARRMLCDSFELIKPFVFGATVWKDDYEDLRARYPSLPEDPYYFLLDRCMYRLIQGMFERPRDEGIVVYCDQDKDEVLVKELAKWHADFLRADRRRFRQSDQERRILTTYGSNYEYIPLQAADVVAHEIMRLARDGHAGRSVVPAASWILARLFPHMPFQVPHFSKQDIEAELDGRAFEPGMWPGYRFSPPPEGC